MEVWHGVIIPVLLIRGMPRGAVATRGGPCRARRKRLPAWIDPGGMTASNTIVRGHGAQDSAQRRIVRVAVARAKLEIVCIIAFESSTRPGRFAVLNQTVTNSDGPKLPKMKGKSTTCTAP